MDESTITGLIIGLLVGLPAGAAAAWLWSRVGGTAGAESAKQQAAYQEEVADHFVKTAELVNSLTDSYKEVFDHLRQGAETLVDEETLRKRLSREEEKDVTLHLIGYRSADGREGSEGGATVGEQPSKEERIAGDNKSS